MLRGGCGQGAAAARRGCEQGAGREAKQCEKKKTAAIRARNGPPSVLLYMVTDKKRNTPTYGPGHAVCGSDGIYSAAPLIILACEA